MSPKNLPTRYTTFGTGKGCTESGKSSLAHFCTFGLSRRNHKRRMHAYASRIKAVHITFVSTKIEHA